MSKEISERSERAQIRNFIVAEVKFNEIGDIAILAGVVNFLPHPNPPREFGEGVRNSQMI